METCRGQVPWLWAQHLKKQTRPSHITLSTDLCRDIDFYQGKKFQGWVLDLATVNLVSWMFWATKQQSELLNVE